MAKCIPSIKIGNEVYEVKDTTAREHLVEVSASQPSSEDNRLWIKDAEQEYQVPTYEEFGDLKSAIETKLPNAPTTNGNYILKATVSGGTASYSWESVT